MAPLPYLSLLLTLGGTHAFVQSPQPLLASPRTHQHPGIRHHHHGHHLSAISKKQTASSKSSSSSSSSRQNRIRSLLDWAKTMKIQSATNIQLQENGPAGLGWFVASSSSSSSIPAGAVVLSVPSDIALTVTCPGDGPDDASVMRRLLQDTKSARQQFRNDLPWFVQMSLYLYKLDRIDSTKNNNAKQLNLRPWLDCLPRQFDTPIHWDDNELQELQYQYLVEAVQRQEKVWKSYYKQLLAIMANKDSAQQQQLLSWPMFVWGCECARSRAFSGGYTGSAFNPALYAFTLLLVTAYVGLDLGTLEQAANGAVVVVCATILKDFVVPKLLAKSSTRQQRYVLSPMLDMANHQSNTATSSSAGSMGKVAFEYFANAYSLAISTTPAGSSSSSDGIAPGEPIFISYGARSNDQWLQYYGFCETDNPHDVYVMPPLREWDIGTLEQACGRTFGAGRLELLDRAGLLGATERKASNDTITVATGSRADATEYSADNANVSGGVVLTRTTGMDPAVLQALRVLVSTDQEWNAAGKAIGTFAQEFSGGTENEACARLAARKAVEMELASKATTLQDDQELLKRMETMKSLDASRPDILAVQFRIEKKKLLQETIQKLN